MSRVSCWGKGIVFRAGYTVEKLLRELVHFGELRELVHFVCSFGRQVSEKGTRLVLPWVPFGRFVMEGLMPSSYCCCTSKTIHDVSLHSL